MLMLKWYEYVKVASMSLLGKLHWITSQLAQVTFFISLVSHFFSSARSSCGDDVLLFIIHPQPRRAPTSLAEWRCAFKIPNVSGDVQHQLQHWPGKLVIWERERLSFLTKIIHCDIRRRITTSILIRQEQQQQWWLYPALSGGFSMVPLWGGSDAR